MSEKPISPLRRRMIEDMTVRNFVEKTHNDYIRHVRTFTAFLGRAPDTAAPEDLRLFQLHQTQAGVGAPSINGSVAALRFFFTVTLDRPEMARHLTFVRRRILTACSKLFTRRNRAVWGLGCRSACQLSKRIMDDCGRARICPAAPAFNSPCRRSQPLRREAALVSRPKEQATRPRVLLWVKLRSRVAFGESPLISQNGPSARPSARRPGQVLQFTNSPASG
jgi:Phage integrase, N-terminal SAM-like domain